MALVVFSLQMGCQEVQDSFPHMPGIMVGMAGRLCLAITVDKSIFVGLLQERSPRVVELLTWQIRGT